MSRRVLAALTTALLLSSASALEASIDAPIAADTHAMGPSDAAVRGRESGLQVVPGGGAWLRFDLRTLPDGISSVDVADATLSLWVRTVERPGKLGVRAVLDPWSESTLVGASAPGVIEDVLASAPVGKQSENGLVSIDVTEIVRAWVDGSLPNHGIELISAGQGGAFRFDSKESTGGGHEPRLRVQLGTPGAPTGNEVPIAFHGPEGDPGPQGDPGLPGPQGASLNPLKVSHLAWVPAETMNYQISTGAHPIRGLVAGAYMWFVDWDAGQVRRLDLVTGLGNSFWVGSGPVGMSSDTITLWVLNYAADTITRLSLIDGSNLGTFAVGDGPTGIAFDGTDMWLANNLEDTIWRIRASDRAVIGNYPLADGPREIIVDGPDLWITCTNSGTLVRMRRSDGAVQATYGGFAQPIGLANDGERIWVANFGDHVATAVSRTDGTVVHTVDVGAGVFDVLFDGTSIWATSATNDVVKKIRPSDGAVLGTFAAGDTPEGLLFDGTHVWAANSRSNTATRY
ncbi:MAG TPA: DNRLRE domain-containing protein [Candidatus Saccharimonadales bacterium]|nr:DNRLRE domain-containing protein [Candidatus Saccharimonadales bacterium]